MKTIIALVAIAAIAAPLAAQGSNSVRGYVRKDGVYVAPSMRTNPNATRTDNWSSAPNINPYTGRTGTVDPYAYKPAPNPYAPKPVKRW